MPTVSPEAGPDGDLLQQRAEDLHAAASARQAQEGQAGLRCQRSVDPQSVIHEEPVGAARMVSTDAAGSQRTSGAWTRRSLSISCVAVTGLLLLKVPVAAVLPTKNWAKSAVVVLEVRSAHGDVLLQADAAGEGGQQRAVLGADRGGGVPDLEVGRGALQHCSRGVCTELVSASSPSGRRSVPPPGCSRGP